MEASAYARLGPAYVRFHPRDLIHPGFCAGSSVRGSGSSSTARTARGATSSGDSDRVEAGCCGVAEFDEALVAVFVGGVVGGQDCLHGGHGPCAVFDAWSGPPVESRAGSQSGAVCSRIVRLLRYQNLDAQHRCFDLAPEPAQRRRSTACQRLQLVAPVRQILCRRLYRRLAAEPDSVGGRRGSPYHMRRRPPVP